MTDIIDTLVAAWNLDATLIAPALLNGANVVRYDLPEPGIYPCARLRLENNVGSLGIGYDMTGVRERQNIVAVDIWTRTGQQHADAITARVDILALRGVPGTRGWEKIGHTQQWDKAAMAWHNVARYTGTEKITDS